MAGCRFSRRHAARATAGTCALPLGAARETPGPESGPSRATGPREVSARGCPRGQTPKPAVEQPRDSGPARRRVSPRGRRADEAWCQARAHGEATRGLVAAARAGEAGKAAGAASRRPQARRRQVMPGCRARLRV